MLMRQVYIGARQVIAWVGPNEEGSDRLMEVFKETGEEAEKLGLGDMSTSEGVLFLTTMVSQPNMDDPKTIAFKTLFTKSQPYLMDLVDSMLHFYPRPWFRRTWIIQEMALGKRVYIQCGQKTEEVMILFCAMCILNFCWTQNTSPVGSGVSREDLHTWQKLHKLEIPLARLVVLRNKAQAFLCGNIPSREHGMPMANYLSFCYLKGNMETTDPRDKIFGLLALSPDIGVLGIKPDYDATVETADTRATGAIFRRGNGRGGPTIELLKLCQFPRVDTLVHLPSWVPDWRMTLRQSFCSENFMFAAGRPEVILPVVHDDVSDETIIGLRGYSVDQIEDVGEPWQPDSNIIPAGSIVDRTNGEIYRVLKARSWAALILLAQIKAFCDKAFMKLANRGHSTDRLEEAHWRVPCGDISGNSSGDSRATDNWNRAYNACLEGHQSMTEEDPIRFRGYWQPLRAGRTDEEKLRLVSLAGNYNSHMSTMTNMRPFITENRYLGMAPMEAKTGDDVVVFIGAATPFVLRNLKDGKFRLLGEAYCHLVMDGEILSLRKESSFLLA